MSKGQSISGFGVNDEVHSSSVQVHQPGGGAGGSAGGNAGGVPLLVVAPPASIPGVPAGLEYLTTLDQLLVHQQVALLEVFTGWEVSNRYEVKNSMGQQVFFAGEESDCCSRQWCGGSRGFIMHIVDNFGREVMRIVRQFKCCAGWNCCAGAECCSCDVTVESPVGQLLGSVRQQKSCWTVKYKVFNANDDAVFAINGPCCPVQYICCTDDIRFPIVTVGGDQSEVGVVSKQWGGVAREWCTKADNFAVSFPVDLDVRMKATLLGALFLIDFMLYEHND